MRIAVVNEISAAHRNIDIIEALRGFGHEIFNVGMQNPGQQPSLTYIHTGLMAGVLLNLDAVDMVVGGCGTGQGFMNSAMQYPGVFCGLIADPLDAWLFSQINAGNCISLSLNKGYGWAGDVNLRYVFEKLFRDGMGAGYPENRKESQIQSRETLHGISHLSHRTMEEILDGMDKELTDLIFPMKIFRTLIVEKSRNVELRDRIMAKFMK